MGKPEMYLLDGWVIIPAWSVSLIEKSAAHGDERAVEMMERLEPIGG
jgi:hypothetical protein